MKPWNKKGRRRRKFCVLIHFEGAMNYFIDADTKEEAYEKAECLFGKEMAEKVIESIGGLRQPTATKAKKQI